MSVTQRPPIVASPPAVPTVTPRPRAVCPSCQHPKPVRASGVMARHRSFTGDWCSGKGLTPIPVPVREPDFSRAGYLDGKTLGRWDFLSLPLLTLLHIARAEVYEVAEPGFTGSIRPVAQGGWQRWVVWMPIGADVLDHDLKVRGLLAAVHGIDVSDWPAELVLRSA